MLITSWSDFHQSLDEYPKHLKGKKLHKWLINSLKNRKRISCFEISSDMRMCRTFCYLQKIGKIKLTNDGYEYPYHGVSIR